MLTAGHVVPNLVALVCGCGGRCSLAEAAAAAAVRSAGRCSGSAGGSARGGHVVGGRLRRLAEVAVGSLPAARPSLIGQTGLHAQVQTGLHLGMHLLWRIVRCREGAWDAALCSDIHGCARWPASQCLGCLYTSSCHRATLQPPVTHMRLSGCPELRGQVSREACCK